MNAEELNVLWFRTLESDRQAYESIYIDLYPALFCYAEGVLHDEDSSRDLLRTLFLTFWENRQHIAVVGNIKIYFFLCLRTEVLKLKRGQAQNALVKTGTKPGFRFQPGQLYLLKGSERDTELALEKMNQLPVKSRELAYMRLFLDLSDAEILEITGYRYKSAIVSVTQTIAELKANYKIPGSYAA